LQAVLAAHLVPFGFVFFHGTPAMFATVWPRRGANSLQ
jgi:hypothetical protein